MRRGDVVGIDSCEASSQADRHPADPTSVFDTGLAGNRKLMTRKSCENLSGLALSAVPEIVQGFGQPVWPEFLLAQNREVRPYGTAVGPGSLDLSQASGDFSGGCFTFDLQARQLRPLGTQPQSQMSLPRGKFRGAHQQLRKMCCVSRREVRCDDLLRFRFSAEEEAITPGDCIRRDAHI